MKVFIKKTGLGRQCITGIIFALVLLTGCEKYLNIPLPANQVAGSGAFITDASTSSVLSGIFYNIVGSSYVAGGSSIGFDAALYTDELANFDPTNSNNVALYTDNIQSQSIGMWGPLYAHIYACNNAIEGIQGSTAILVNRNQYLGEAYFTRAWLYFNLVNLFGDVPLAVTTNFQNNNVLSRAPQAQVYAQILADLQKAQAMLPNDFRDGTGTTTAIRARPNKFAATALLARLYLARKDWVNAEAQATTVINNTTLQMCPLTQTFLSTSTEMIWGLSPTGSSYVNDYSTYNNGMPAAIVPPKSILSYGLAASLSTTQVNNFEANDARYTNWVRAVTDVTTAKTYYFPNKYKSNTNGVEYIVVLRLAEQYLIRAEARAEQNNVQGAQSDLNVVRTRAGLPATAAATQADLLTAILKERQSEFFTEQGMRFFDLKRTGTIDAVMNVIVAQKGGTWASFKQLWPISATDIIGNPNLVQNPGY
jgi:starch-binding outer membrane protein, SusD/RagB family